MQKTIIPYCLLLLVLFHSFYSCTSTANKTNTTDTVGTIILTEDHNRDISLEARRLNLQGLASNRANNFSKSVDLFTRAIAINPNFADAYLNRSYAYIQLQRFDDAISDCNQAIRFSHNLACLACAYLNRGLSNGMSGRVEESIKDFNLAIENKPNFGEAFYDRGYAYFLLKKIKNACTDWKQADALGFPMATPMLDKHCR